MPEGENFEDEIKQEYEALLQKIEANDGLIIEDIKNDIADILSRIGGDEYNDNSVFAIPPWLKNKRLADPKDHLGHIKKTLNDINRSLTLDMHSLTKNVFYSILSLGFCASCVAIAVITGGVFFGVMGALAGLAATYFGKGAYNDFKRPSLNLKNLPYKISNNRENFQCPEPVTSLSVTSSNDNIVNKNPKEKTERPSAILDGNGNNDTQRKFMSNK